MKKLFVSLFILFILIMTSCNPAEDTTAQTAFETTIFNTTEETSMPATTVMQTTIPETTVPETTVPETTAVLETTTIPETTAKELPKTVKDMISLGLSYVEAGYGYSLNSREGQNHSFDCSGFVAVLLRDGLSENQIGWFLDGAWDTAYWRYYATTLSLGQQVQLGDVTYVVTMKDSYDFDKAWEIPGSIVIQYPPENDESIKMGHASIALGRIPYQTADDVIQYLTDQYGIRLDGLSQSPNGVPQVFDQYGADAGHNTWKINANGVEKAVIVDNNYSSNPDWIEKISLVLSPME